MSRPGTWAKGQSGNPNGRPPKGRALTEILERQGARTLEDIDGKRRGGKYIVARALWEIATTGKTTLPGDPPMMLLPDPQDWIKVVQWLYQHIDGSAVQRLSHEGTGEGGAIIVEQRYTDAERVRGLGALFDAVRTGVLAGGYGGDDALDADERSAMAGVSESGG